MADQFPIGLAGRIFTAHQAKGRVPTVGIEARSLWCTSSLATMPGVKAPSGQPEHCVRHQVR